MFKIIDFILAHPILDLIVFFEIRKYLFIKKAYPFFYSVSYSTEYTKSMIEKIVSYCNNYCLNDMYIRRSINRSRLYIRTRRPLSENRDMYYYEFLDHSGNEEHIFDYTVYDLEAKYYLNMDKIKNSEWFQKGAKSY